MFHDPNDWIQWFQQAEKADIAGLAVTVFEAWHDRDPLAKGVIQEAAEGLAQDALACAKRLKSKHPLYALAGSVFLKQPAFIRLFTRKLRQQETGAKVVPLPMKSAWGTIFAAQSLLRKTLLEKTTAKSAANQRDVETSSQKNSIKVPTSTDMSPTEQRLEASMKLDRLSLPKAFDLFLDEEEVISRALKSEKNNILKWVRWVAETFRQGGKLFYVGAGTSGRLGVLDASECPPTFGVSPEMVQGIMAGGRTALWHGVEGAEDDFEAGWRAMPFRGFQSKDIVLGIAASGRTPFVHGALAFARSIQARHGLLCFNPHLAWPKKHRPDLVICPETGPEILTGSTRLKAGTATKWVLNFITTLAMVRLGKVKSNLMIDVQASNTKLKDRAVRMVMTLTGESKEAAKSALETTRWSISEASLKLERKRSRRKA